MTIKRVGLIGAGLMGHGIGKGGEQGLLGLDHVQDRPAARRA